MSLPQLLFPLLIPVPDSGCTTVCVITLGCLGTALSLSFQPVMQAHVVFLTAVPVSEGQWCSYLTGSLFSARPYAGQ
jgi:hypothetical protein